MTGDQANPLEHKRIGDRFLVEAELGQGGMARVYRAFDERSNTRCALKKLVVGDKPNATIQAMFEREYHTLVQLAHPRIVRAFDYRVEADGPFYTMELLEGEDARTLVRGAPLSVTQICTLLRDAASALALIHSRRVVHRDVSPRNLWCTPDGHAKLIDFGTLVAMGPQTRIAGTPPYVPPEAVYMQPLDGRCDIYGLGALGYYLLTRRNAYPAREIAELRGVWQRRPLSPLALQPDLPPALVELVMAMISLDARARPGSAAEVFERLSAIGELAVEDERHLAQAFLSSPRLVGREDACELVRRRLLRSKRGRGGTTAIVARPGLGRSRMLVSLVLEAKLIGAHVALVDASAVGSGAFALAGALAERVLDLVPHQKVVTPELAAVLGHVSPGLHRAVGQPQLAPLSSFERSARIGAALVALFDDISREQHLVLAIDDVQRADGASLGVLGRLSLLSAERSLLIATACEAGVLNQAPPALEQLVKPASRIELAPLDAEHTRELLDSLFGAVPGLEEAAGFLHELSEGSPQACMQYAQYLVDHGLARYERGRWSLAEQLRDRGIPRDIAAVITGRLAGLSEDARAFALGMALARDETRSAWQPENHILIEDFPKLLDSEDSSRAFMALDELLQAGVVQQRDSYYVLGQRVVSDALLQETGADALRRAHLRLANLFAKPGYHQLLQVHHLQAAGEHARACALLAGVGRSSAEMDWGAMRLSRSAETARRALEYYETHGGSPREGVSLRRVLLLTCSVYDWSNARCGDAQLAQAWKDAGLEHFAATDPTQPLLARTLECLQKAQAAYDQLPEAERGLNPLDAVRELASSVLILSGAFVNSHDVARARALPAMIEPLRPLTPVTELFCEFAGLAVDRVVGREIGDRTSSAVERLFAAEGLPEVLRLGASGVMLHVHLMEEARRGRTDNLHRLDQISAVVGETMFLVVHARWLVNAFAGNAALARGFCKQVEIITEDDVWRRKTFLFVEAQLHALTGDLTALGRTSQTIAELAESFEGWRPWADYARGETHRLRGELAEADEALAAALARAMPGEHRAWVLAAPAHAELQLMRDAPEAARTEAEAIVEAVERLSLDQSAAVAAERIGALAHSQFGAHDAARAAIECAFARAESLRFGGLPLAQLWEAKARIALAAGSSNECALALTRMRELLEHADAPALIRRFEALREESLRELSHDAVPAAMAPGRGPITETLELFTQISSRLQSLRDREQRLRHALELLLEECAADSGYLLLFGAEGLFSAASIAARDQADAVMVLATRYLEQEREGTRTEAVTVIDRGASRVTAPALTIEGGAALWPVWLSDHVNGELARVGLALIGRNDGTPRPARPEFVQAVSRCLVASGDSRPVPIDD